MFSLSSSEMLLRLILACVCGGIIGWEREIVQKPAGFRTHVLVCVGSAVTMLISVFIYNNMRASSSSVPDPARLGAQVISGIGFLGAGTIIREGSSIKGLTTAASLWTVACIGLAIGIGYYSVAAAATVIVVVVLEVFNRLENTRVFTSRQIVRLAVKIEDKPGQLALLTSALGEMGVSIHDIKIERDNDDSVTILLTLKTKGNISINSILDTLSGIKDIIKIDQL